MNRISSRLICSFLLTAGALLSAGAQETLRVDHFDTSVLASSWDLALQFFRASHPGVSAALQFREPEEVRLNAEELLMGNNPPDVLEFSPGMGTSGAESASGRFQSLSVEAVRRGWDHLLPLGVQPWVRYDVRGRMGPGLWYGIPSTGDFVQVYYNRGLFEKYGVKIPKTFGEFQVALETFRKAGVVPLALGASGYPCQELFYELFLSQASLKEVEDFQNSRGGAGLRTPAWTFAAGTLSTWAEAGYFGPLVQNLDARGQLEEFLAGHAAMTVMGSEAFPRLQRAPSSFDWDSFLFPGNPRHTGGIGPILVIPVRSPHPDWAAEFIGLTLRSDVQNSLADKGGLALAADLNQVDNPGARRLIRTFYKLLDDHELALFPDWPAVGFYDSLRSGGIDLIRGVPPDQVLEGLDLAYQTKMRIH